MGASMMIARWVGKKLSGALPPVKDGIMMPYIYKYADKVKDLASESNKVNENFLKNIIEEAHNKRDFEALRVVHDYLQRMDWNGSMMRKVIQYGQDIKLRETVGDPFALLESVVRHLC